MSTLRFAAPSALLLFLLAAPVAAGDEVLLPSRPVVFAGVTVVDVTAGDAGSALGKNQSVLVVGDRIAAVGESIVIPPEADIIDAIGKFLIPGLWDMHVHIADPGYLPLFVANGVTGVRDMGGAAAADDIDGCESIAPAQLIEWRQGVRSGQRIGPDYVLGGPAASGTGWPGSLAVRTPEQAREAIGALRELGVDFVKVYEGIPLEAYRALASAATDAGLPLAGHVPMETVSPLQAVDAGQRSIEHVRDHVLMCFTDKREELGQFFADDHWSAADVEWGMAMHLQCPRLIDSLRRHEAWLVPTLTVERAKVAVEEPAFVADPRRASLPAGVRSGFGEYVAGKLKQSAADRKSERLWWNTQKKLVARMHAEGVRLLAGTDSACEGGLPGYSLHEELRLLVEAGLSPFEALKAATINPARYLSRVAAAGSIEAGKRADLVLLSANPLEDIGATTRIDAVVANGRLLRRAELDALLPDAELVRAPAPVAGLGPRGRQDELAAPR